MIFRLGFLFTLFLGVCGAKAQDLSLVANKSGQIVETLTVQNIDAVAILLHTIKPAPHLRCGIKIRQLKELRKFSTGERFVEMIEVKYSNNQDYGGIEMKTYFPLGAKISRMITNSEFSGTVEEIKLESADRLDHWLTVHHDGKGQLVWAEMGNVYTLNPCQLRP